MNLQNKKRGVWGGVQEFEVGCRSCIIEVFFTDIPVYFFVQVWGSVSRVGGSPPTLLNEFKLWDHVCNIRLGGGLGVAPQPPTKTNIADMVS